MPHVIAKINNVTMHTWMYVSWFMSQMILKTVTLIESKDLSKVVKLIWVIWAMKICNFVFTNTTQENGLHIRQFYVINITFNNFKMTSNDQTNPRRSQNMTL